MPFLIMPVMPVPNVPRYVSASSAESPMPSSVKLTVLASAFWSILIWPVKARSCCRRRMMPSCEFWISSRTGVSARL